MAQAVSEFGRVDIRDHLAAQLKELEQWQSLSESSDFPDDGPDTKDD